MKNLDGYPSALLWHFISSLAIEQQVLGLQVVWLFLYFSSGLCFLYERPVSSTNNLNCRLKLGNSKAPSAWRKLYR